MLLLDNLLLSPLMWIFREINATVQKEQAGEAEAVTRSLSELYMQLDTGAISEAEFEVIETRLLDRLDAIRDRSEAEAEADEDEDEDEYDEDDDEYDEDDEDNEEDEDEDEDEDEESDAVDGQPVGANEPAQSSLDGDQDLRSGAS
jgi:hypothetical protein